MRVVSDTLLMDESDGREVARALGIRVSGAVGVLISARQKGWIPALKPELLALRALRQAPGVIILVRCESLGLETIELLDGGELAVVIGSNKPPINCQDL